MTGGSFPFDVFLKKSIQYGGFIQNDTVDVWLFATSVHVSLFCPKSFGTVIAKTPYWRPVLKWVGWP